MKNISIERKVQKYIENQLKLQNYKIVKSKQISKNEIEFTVLINNNYVLPIYYNVSSDKIYEGFLQPADDTKSNKKYIYLFIIMIIVILGIIIMEVV